MTPEEQEELTKMATLYDSLSPTLKQIFVSQIGYGEMIISKELSAKLNSDHEWCRVSTDGQLKMKCEASKEGYLVYPETIQNTSNASSHIDVLKEENNDMCGIYSVDMDGKCFKCGGEQFGHFELCQKCLGFNHSGNGNF